MTVSTPGIRHAGDTSMRTMRADGCGERNVAPHRKPSAITRDGHLFRNPFGLDPRIVAPTIREAVLCRRERIPIATFMIADDPVLKRFVEDLTRANKGQAYFASPDDLGGAVFVDFLRNRRRRA